MRTSDRGSQRPGAYLYLVHTLAALLTGTVLCRLEREPALLESRLSDRGGLPAKTVSFPQVLTASAAGAVTSTLHICAFVVLFRVLAALAPAGVPAPALGVLEMVTGVAALAPGKAGFVAAAAIVGWGGLSVHCQALAAAAPAGLSFRWHWVGKAAQAALSAVLAAGVYRLL